MTQTPQRSVRRSLVRELRVWVALSTTIGLCVFAAIAVDGVIIDEEAEPDHDSPEAIWRKARNKVGGAMLVAAPVGLLLAVGGASFATRRALLPLQRVIDSAASVTARELNTRLPLPAAENEVHALVLAFNSLFSRLETGFTTLDRFAADASHELRTPLSVMATELEVMLASSRSEADWIQSADLCLSEVRHLTQLIEALLNMARADRAPEPPGLTVLRDAVDRAVSSVAPLAASRGVEIEVAMEEEADCHVAGDTHALMSALINVLDNAVRYTPAGGHVLVWSDVGAAQSVLVNIDDTGSGIDPLEHERIFEPFMRGATGRAAANGLGLGLSIARRICEHNRTLLSVGRSASGGARFSFTFQTLAD